MATPELLRIVPPHQDQGRDAQEDDVRRRLVALGYL
jgi:hypothetical protein